MLIWSIAYITSCCSSTSDLPHHPSPPSHLSPFQTHLYRSGTPSAFLLLCLVWPICRHEAHPPLRSCGGCLARTERRQHPRSSPTSVCKRKAYPELIHCKVQGPCEAERGRCPPLVGAGPPPVDREPEVGAPQALAVPHR
jgi:hypothetical protein